MECLKPWGNGWNLGLTILLFLWTLAAIISPVLPLTARIVSFYIYYSGYR